MLMSCPFGPPLRGHRIVPSDRVARSASWDSIKSVSIEPENMEIPSAPIQVIPIPICGLKSQDSSIYSGADLVHVVLRYLHVQPNERPDLEGLRCHGVCSLGTEPYG